MTIPSGPYRANYFFTRHKRRNPDMHIHAPSGTVAIVPRFGDQARQESAAFVFAAAIEMLTALEAVEAASKAPHYGDTERVLEHFHDAMPRVRAAIAKAYNRET